MSVASTAKLIEAARVADLKDGEMRKLTVEGKEVLLARAAGKYYAAEHRCPHMGGHLSEGKLEGTTVTCPRHRSQFDLTDGHVVRWTNWSGLNLSLAKLFKPPRPLKTYKVTIENDKVLIEF